MRRYTILLIFSFTLFSSCEKYFEVDLDDSQVLSDVVFEDDRNAKSALIGVYKQAINAQLMSGGPQGVSAVTGLSADELINPIQDPIFVQFQRNELLVNNSILQSQWTHGYELIYQVNDIIASLEKSKNVSAPVKQQLTGESYFIRALCHFFLTNMFGDIPIITSEDYRINAKASRASQYLVYEQIVNDLKNAQMLLTDTYPDTERVRANKAAVTALLARVYLYMQNWDAAIASADEVIANPAYSIVTDMNNVFLKESEETIFQLASHDNSNTGDAAAFIPDGALGSLNHIMNDVLYNSFEPGDQRKALWTGTVTVEGSGEQLHYAFKYKEFRFGVPTVEHNIVLRLAEQYLIRAEAYAHKSQLDKAIENVDEIRDRAGLPLIADTDPGISQAALLNRIIEERRHELFTEWGHRWFDLKRTKRANDVIGPLKPNWSANDTLYPVPRSEFALNPNLGEQNKGY